MKKTAMALAAGAVFGLGASLATAHPTDAGSNSKRVPQMGRIHLESPQVDFCDDFESYQVGSDIVGQGGWELWYTGGESAVVSDEHGSKNMKQHAFSDIVQRFNISEGQWVLSVDTYLPSGSGEAFIILMSNYANGNDQWNIQFRMDSEFGVVEVQFLDVTAPVILDQWVNFRAEIDLDADTAKIFYNNELLWEGAYTEGVNGTGSTDIAALDLYSNGADPVYFDNVCLTEVGGGDCYADFTGDNVLDLFDFLAFVNSFNAGEDKANCDNEGGLDLFDFLCFTNEFNAGC
jgi:hypothetical protein